MYRTSTVFTHSIAARVPCSVLSMVVVVVVPFWSSFGASYSVFPRLLIVLRVAVPDPTRSILDPHDAVVDPSYPDRCPVASISLAAVAVAAASADHWWIPSDVPVKISSVVVGKNHHHCLRHVTHMHEKIELVLSVFVSLILCPPHI